MWNKRFEDMGVVCYFSYYGPETLTEKVTLNEAMAEVYIMNIVNV